MCGLPLAHSPLGTWPETQACTLTGNRTANLLVHRLALNPLNHTSQGKLYIFKVGKELKKKKEYFVTHEIQISKSINKFVLAPSHSPWFVSCLQLPWHCHAEQGSCGRPLAHKALNIHCLAPYGKSLSFPGVGD